MNNWIVRLLGRINGREKIIQLEGVSLTDMLELQRYRNMIKIHEDMVAHYTHLLSLLLGVDPAKPVLAAMYHDHGKFLWEKEMFTVPPGEMGEEHWKKIKSHPRRADEVIFTEFPLEKFRFVKGDPSAIDLIVLHHEKPDGSGYYGVRDIPVEAVVVAISDIFDACLSDRPYRDSLNIDVALNEAVKPFGKYLRRKGYDVEEVKKCLKESALKLQAEHKRVL